MARIAFDNDKYLQMQSEHIRDRIAKFGGKLYLEFGGKLYDDNHASRVLPGFQPDLFIGPSISFFYIPTPLQKKENPHSSLTLKRGS